MDIDIDLQSSFDPLILFPEGVRASMVNKKGELVKHPCGVYLQNIAVDPITKFAAIPYEEAEALGYFKIDFLKLTLLDDCNSKQQIRELISQEPDWHLLQDQNVVEQLFQIHNQFKILQIIKPSSVQELADTIALIRPGKKHLLEDYIKDRQSTRSILYAKTGDGYFFKKSHAISYALTIVLQLHLIKNQSLNIA